jgi:acyl-CoA dehydrogenase
MSDKAYLEWPFFDETHRDLAATLEDWAAHNLRDTHHAGDVDSTCRALVAGLGQGGWLRYAVPGAFGGARATLESRCLCLIRETLARHSALADFAFAMQGLGSGPISLHGTEELKQRYLPRVARGEWIAAFALSEPDAGSDVAAIAATARVEGAEYVLNGTKTWISNGGIANFYTVIVRTGEGPGAKGLTAVVVDAGTGGLEIAERINVTAPHPLATLRFRECRVPMRNRLGEPGAGFKVAMETLDVFRASVAAAALGLARRALDEGLARARGRKMFGQVLADFQLTQAAIAEMATAIDSSALLTYRAAWLRDVKGARTTREAAMPVISANVMPGRTLCTSLNSYSIPGLGSSSIKYWMYSCA